MKLIRRNLSLMLALRYLNPLRTMFSIITLICLGGVALGVMVLIVVLSVMQGLQQEMESRVLAFAPHYIVGLTSADGKRACLTDAQVDWQQAQQDIAALPTVVSVYPQLENEAFAQSQYGRMTVHFNALEPHNKGQVTPLEDMLREGTFDFGEGLDEECVISLATATSLGLALGDTLHLTPVGSLDEVATIYAMIQNPLQTQEEAFCEAVYPLFDGAAETEQGLVPTTEKWQSAFNAIATQDPAKLRDSEKEHLSTLFTLLTEHTGAVPFSAEEKQRWDNTVAVIRELDRDREDGKAVKSINEMVMPIDLRIIGIYQPPENMPGPNVYLPLQIAQDVMGFSADGENQVQGLCVRVQDANNPGDIEARIGAVLPAVTPRESDEFAPSWFLTPWTRSFEQWYKLIANERVMMSFVLSIISLIASFCIMAVMFTMSIQRKREIAVLQAMGATPAKIMGIFAWQGVIIGFIGALSGIGLALLVLHYRLEIQAALASIGMDPFPMQAHGITLPAVYDPATFAFQALQAFIMVCIAAIIPAYFVSRQDPAKALRSN